MCDKSRLPVPPSRAALRARAAHSLPPTPVRVSTRAGGSARRRILYVCRALKCQERRFNFGEREYRAMPGAEHLSVICGSSSSHPPPPGDTPLRDGGGSGALTVSSGFLLSPKPTWIVTRERHTLLRSHRDKRRQGGQVDGDQNALNQMACRTGPSQEPVHSVCLGVVPHATPLSTPPRTRRGKRARGQRCPAPTSGWVAKRGWRRGGTARGGRAKARAPR